MIAAAGFGLTERPARLDSAGDAGAAQAGDDQADRQCFQIPNHVEPPFAGVPKVRDIAYYFNR
jgi:hypothetical protein